MQALLAGLFLWLISAWLFSVLIVFGGFKG